MSGPRAPGRRARRGAGAKRPPVEVGIPEERRVGALAVAFRRVAAVL